MKLLIVGSRKITNFDVSSHIPAGVDTIISGRANGVDALAEQYADSHRLSKYIIRLVTIYMGVPHQSSEMNKWLTLQMLYLLFGTVTQKEHSIPFNMQRKVEKKQKLFWFDFL